MAISVDFLEAIGFEDDGKERGELFGCRPVSLEFPDYESNLYFTFEPKNGKFNMCIEPLGSRPPIDNFLGFFKEAEDFISVFKLFVHSSVVENYKEKTQKISESKTQAKIKQLEEEVQELKDRLKSK